jgi:isocitrate lyase
MSLCFIISDIEIIFLNSILNYLYRWWR